MKSSLLVADAGPLIVLGLADLLRLAVQIYGLLAVPEAVLRECLVQQGLPGEDAVRNAVKSKHLSIVSTDSLLPLDPLTQRGLGGGETAVLVYARSNMLAVLIDDRKARSAARRLALPLVGSGAVLLSLKKTGRIASVRAVLDLWSAHGYYVGEGVKAALLEAASE